MNLRFLRTFLAVHGEGSISQAAEKVHLSPAAVSAQLKSVENELGLVLFERTGCALKSTSAADRLAPLAREMLATQERMRALAAPLATPALLRIGAIPSALPQVLPRMLAATRRKFPDTEIKVVEDISAKLVQQLRGGALDCAIVTQPGEPVGGDLRTEPLYADPFVLLGPPEAAGLPLHTVMHRLPYIAVDRATWTGRMIESYLEQAGLRVTPMVEIGSLQAISVLVRSGAGVSIVPWPRGTPAPATAGLVVQALGGFQRPVVLVQRPELARTGLRDLWHACLSPEAEVEAR